MKNKTSTALPKRKKKRMPKMSCPYCPGQIYFRKGSKSWKCWRCKKVIT